MNDRLGFIFFKLKIISLEFIYHLDQIK